MLQCRKFLLRRGVNNGFFGTDYGSDRGESVNGSSGQLVHRRRDRGAVGAKILARALLPHSCQLYHAKADSDCLMSKALYYARFCRY